MKDKKIDLAIVIVNFNGGDHIISTLESLFMVSNEANLTVWVSDNKSSDQSVEKIKKQFPQVKLILNSDNLGFGAGNNVALKQINTEFILLLNPDTKVKPGTLDYMIKFMEDNKDVGAASCKIVHSDGSMDWASHRGLPTPLASLLYFLGNDRLYHLSNKDMSKPHEVDSIAGSFFLTRKSVLEKAGFFDEDYWLYGEDLDLCFRIKKAGFKVMFVPNVEVLHLKGVSSGIKKQSEEISTATKQSKIRAFNSFYETMKIFYKKNLEKDYPFFINWLVYLGVDIRWFLAKRHLKV